MVRASTTNTARPLQFLPLTPRKPQPYPALILPTLFHWGLCPLRVEWVELQFKYDTLNIGLSPVTRRVARRVRACSAAPLCILSTFTVSSILTHGSRVDCIIPSYAWSNGESKSPTVKRVECRQLALQSRCGRGLETVSCLQHQSRSTLWTTSTLEETDY